MQITSLLSGTMRRISRARSIVSGVELWHPAKPLLENRVEFVHCIVIIMHCLPKLFSQSRFVSKTPRLLFKRQNRVPGIFCFGRYRFADGPFKSNQIFIYFGRSSRTGRPTRTTAPDF